MLSGRGDHSQRRVPDPPVVRRPAWKPAGGAPLPSFQPADWEFGETWSNHVMTLKCDVSSASEEDRRYYELVTELRGQPPRHATLWLCRYPNVMLEWYPEALAVSFLLPTAPSITRIVVDLFYPRDILTEHPESSRPTRPPTTRARRRTGSSSSTSTRGAKPCSPRAGRRGPYQEPLEDGMVHFHRWLRSQLGPHL